VQREGGQAEMRKGDLEAEAELRGGRHSSPSYSIFEKDACAEMEEMGEKEEIFSRRTFSSRRTDKSVRA
jgi:hypothetical protein